MNTRQLSQDNIVREIMSCADRWIRVGYYDWDLFLLRRLTSISNQGNRFFELISSLLSSFVSGTNFLTSRLSTEGERESSTEVIYCITGSRKFL